MENKYRFSSFERRRQWSANAWSAQTASARLCTKMGCACLVTAGPRGCSSSSFGRRTTKTRFSSSRITILIRSVKMFILDKVFCSHCNIRIYDGEERVLADKGIYHEFCHKIVERTKERRQQLVRLITSSANHRVTVVPHRSPP